tara:strand:- start:1183 stop:1461 length:279 start_codon:yes stop_codon:yes gene_type:complete
MISEIIVISFLVISIGLNVFLLKRMLHFSENVGSVLSSLVGFNKHLEEVNSYELYYGDEVLGKLLEHSKETVDDVKDFQNNYGSGLDDDRTD